MILTTYKRDCLAKQLTMVLELVLKNNDLWHVNWDGEGVSVTVKDTTVHITKTGEEGNIREQVFRVTLYGSDEPITYEIGWDKEETSLYRHVYRIYDNAYYIKVASASYHLDKIINHLKEL